MKNGTKVRPIQIALTYLADMPFADVVSGTITHLWSLAVEEQFYLIWPAFLLLGATLFKGRRAIGIWMLGAAIVLTAVGSTLAIALPPSAVYQLPTTWASAMALGGVAYAFRESIKRVINGYGWAVAAAVVLAALCFLPDAKDRLVTYLVYPNLIAVATIVVIVALESRALPQPTALKYPLGLLASLGIISYGTYLWNLPINVWWGAATSLPAWADVVTIPFTVLAALLSWYTIEAAGRSMRRRFDRGANGRAAPGTP